MSVPGIYTVSGVSEYGCTAFSEPYLYLPTLIPGSGLVGPIIIIPNPAHQQARVVSATPLGAASWVRISDMYGREVRQIPWCDIGGVVIDRGSLPSGVYQVRIGSGSHKLLTTMMIFD